MKSWSNFPNLLPYRKSGSEKSNLRSNFTREVVLWPFLRMRTKSGQNGSKPGQNSGYVGEHGVGWDTGLVETVALRKSRAANYLCCMFYLRINNVSMYRAKLGNFAISAFVFLQKDVFWAFRVSIKCCCSTNFYQSIRRLCGTSLVLICS